ncbi:lysosomal-associated transmembrane protein 5-like [Spea bombifrons]|uniref:lysosomal-associated transmembrane protein 5-like n=1 Tax=Spea bombifrons TaxID=233779 RepID=UPI0023492C77|nr:lysosomal-associated transmembrane protein 5-like [Spea bombifrons]
MVTQEPPRCCGYFSVHSVVLGVAVYYVFVSLQSLVWQTVEVVKCRGVCEGPWGTPGPVMVMYSLAVVLLVLSLCLLFGVLRRRAGLLLPFLAFQIIDFLGSLLLFCGLFVRFPSELRLVSTRPYLVGLESQERAVEAKSSVLFIVLAMLFLLLKIYLIRCVLTYYRFLITRVGPPQGEQDGLALIVVPGSEKNPLLLPSYEEAIRMPAKDSPPPPYSQTTTPEPQKDAV